MSNFVRIFQMTAVTLFTDVCHSRFQYVFRIATRLNTLERDLKMTLLKNAIILSRILFLTFR